MFHVGIFLSGIWFQRNFFSLCGRGLDISIKALLPGETFSIPLYKEAQRKQREKPHVCACVSRKPKNIILRKLRHVFFFFCVFFFNFSNVDAFVV